jgi:acetyl-CoA carboxylase carboxyltransferase component
LTTQSKRRCQEGEGDLENNIKKLRDIKQSILQGGGEEKIAKIHASGKHTARERIDLLLDPGTFYELNPFVGYEVGAPGDGIITGFGEIDGRRVCVYFTRRLCSRG